MADGIIQVPPDSTGKKVDTSEVTRQDGVVVQRQRMIMADDETGTNSLLHELILEIRELKWAILKALH